MKINIVHKILIAGFLSIEFFTRLPMQWVKRFSMPIIDDIKGDKAQFQLSHAVIGLFIVGALLAFLLSIFAFFLLMIGLSFPLTALVCLATLIILTGALHEDGLADCCDGFFGGWDKKRKLEIMRDSHIGSYGTLGLIITILLRYILLIEVMKLTSSSFLMLFLSLFFILTTSRALAISVAYFLPNAREDGLGIKSGALQQKEVKRLFAGCFFMLILLLPFKGALFYGVFFLIGICLPLFTLFSIIAFSKKHIGGYSGDVIGFAQQGIEIACLLSLTFIIS